MYQQRRWGWRQLEPRWAELLVARAPIRAGALVIDVGAGTGAITAELVEVRARVIAVEAHHRRAEVLEERFEHGVVVVRADAADLRLPRRPYDVVANPPFAITHALLRRILQRGSRLRSATLILQDQAARRWASTSAPAFSRWGHIFDARLGPSVPRRAFRPEPRVKARILEIRRRR